MRVLLLKGKQNELLKKVKIKNDFSLKTLAEFLGVKKVTINEWYYERCLIPLEYFKKLDKHGKYKKFVLEIKKEHWGQSKAGKISSGNTKIINKPIFNENLAELVGIVLGDGNILSYSAIKKDKIISTHQLRICGDSRNDYEYLMKKVIPLIKNLFNINPRIYKSKRQNCIYIIADSIELVKFLESIGLKPGNKIKNNLTIPKWIWGNEDFLRSCLRGLFDTDGSVYYLKPHWSDIIQVSFRNYNKRLLSDTQKALKKLGFVTSKIFDKKICITRKQEVNNLFKEIRFNNPKHTRKYEKNN